MALLLQNPGDYLLGERVDRELPAPDLEAAGSATSPPATRATSRAASASGWRSRSCCARRRARRRAASTSRRAGWTAATRTGSPARLRELAAGGTAVVVATHDAEFAAAFAARTVLLGDGRPVADAPTAEVLGGGWYFATQTARVLGGAGRAHARAGRRADRAASPRRWPR